MRSIVLVCLVGMIVSSSCITEKFEIQTTSRIVKNNTNHEVEVIIEANNKYQFTLFPLDSMVFEGEYASGEGSFKSDIGWNDDSPISGKLIFNEEKVLYFQNGDCEEGRNPLTPYIWMFSRCGYLNLDPNQDGNAEYYYFIDDSDYERAVPIED